MMVRFIKLTSGEASAVTGTTSAGCTVNPVTSGIDRLLNTDILGNPRYASVHAALSGKPTFSPIAAFGDSITEYGVTAIGGDPANTDWPRTLATSLGVSLWFNGGVSGETSTQIRNRYLQEGARRNWPLIIWAGTNNWTEREQIVADIGDMVAHALVDEFLVLPLRHVDVLSGGPDTFWIGGAGYNATKAVNDDLLALYPDNFYDINADIIAGYDPEEPQDVVDQQHGVWPLSLRIAVGNGHLNAVGRNLVAASLAAEWVRRGWAPAA